MAERDREYDAYLRSMKRRYGLKDIHIAQGYMRGSDPSWVGQRPEDVERYPGKAHIVLVMGEATLTAGFDPSAVDEMMDEWRHQLQARPPEMDERRFTRQVISQHMALNRHREGDTGELLICAAVWLAATNPDAGEVLRLIKRGDVEFRYDITHEDNHQRTRFRLSAQDLAD